MHIRSYWEHFCEYWRGVGMDFVHDVRRLSVASSVMGVGAVVVGVLRGLAPLTSAIALFRLVDAVTSARSVRVLTSDLHASLMTLLVVWGVGLLVFMSFAGLRGLARGIAERTCVVVMFVSTVLSTTVLAPWRSLALLLNMLVLEAWKSKRAVRLAASLVHAILAWSLLSSMTKFLLSRSLSVGSFVLFLLTILAGLTMTIVAASRRTPHVSSCHSDRGAKRRAEESLSKEQ